MKTIVGHDDNGGIIAVGHMVGDGPGEVRPGAGSAALVLELKDAEIAKLHETHVVDVGAGRLRTIASLKRSAD